MVVDSTLQSQKPSLMGRMEFRKFIGLLSGSATQFLSLAILGLLLAEVLTVEEFGVTRTVTSYMVVLTMLGHMTLHDAVATYVASTEDRDGKSQYVTHSMVLVVVVSVLLASVFHLLVANSGWWAGLSRTALMTVVIILPLECLSILTMSLLNASGNIRSMAVFSVVCGMVPLGIIAPCAATWGVNGWIVARIISSCTVFGIGVLLVREYLRMPRIDIGKVLDLIRFARVQFVSGALSTMMLSGDVIVLERLSHDSKAIGHYGLAVLFSRPLALVASTLGRLYFKDIASSVRNPRQQWDMIHQLIKLTLGVSGILAASVFVFGGAVVRMLYGEQYTDSVKVLEVLSLGLVFSSLWSALSIANIALKIPFGSVITSCTGLVVAGVMFMLFVPAAGAIGAAWSMNAAYMAGCGAGMIFLSKQLKKHN